MEKMQASQAEAVDALIVVDVQNAFVAGLDAVPGHARLVAMVEVLLAQARSAGAPGAMDEPSRPGWALYFSPRSHETVVRKARDDGFDGTDLDGILTALGVRNIAICGVLSEMCVAATAREAMRLGYGVLLPHDAHATYDVPAGPGSESVPAAMAARAAEWSLGDEIRICASAHEVRFVARNDAGQ
jgi:nicotinamidase-related amidase